MKNRYLTILSLFILATLPACGSPSAPTMSPEDVQNTAVAQAWIAITQTQAAMPTATPTFPSTSTFTPQPTFTPLLVILPTFSQQTPAVVATPTSECNQVPPLKPQGQLISIEIKNESTGTVNLSFGMNSPNKKGECVTYGFGLGKFDTIPAKVLAGCYWGYAWITYENGNTSNAQGTQLMCITDPGIIYRVGVGKETIYLK